jgi:hypothetical protein
LGELPAQPAHLATKLSEGRALLFYTVTHLDDFTYQLTSQARLSYVRQDDFVDARGFRGDSFEPARTRFDFGLKIRKVRIDLQPLIATPVDHDSEYQPWWCQLSIGKPGPLFVPQR